MQTTATSNKRGLIRNIWIIVAVLSFTWFYQGTAVYDGAATFVCSVAVITCVYAFMNAMNTRLKTLTVENFLYLRFSNIILMFLVCLCMTLETLILHRPFTF